MSDHPIAFRSPFNGGTAWVSPETATPDFLAAFEKAGFVRLPAGIDETHEHVDSSLWQKLSAAPAVVSASLDLSITTDVPVKRGPGRPRKQPLTTEG
jgi:hypothetical protein